uniref:phasin family protein n=1 Tax=Ningiella ruwaisensis TaxID=2364274 RepID=UPI0010A07E13|nr:phasin family protein [Ningiella ruwaisensis]
MFGNFSQQLKKSTKPASTLLEMNAKTLELVSKQQTIFFSGVMTDSVKLLETLSDQTELKGMIAAQSVYAESVRERFTSASKSTYSALNAMRNDVADVMKSSLEDAKNNAQEVVEQAVKTATSGTNMPSEAAAPAKAKSAASAKPAKASSPKKPSAKKPAAKKAVAPKKAAPAPKVQAKAEAKTITPQATPPVIEKSADKAEGSKPTQNKPAVSASKAKKPAPKKAVASLSAADVKAKPADDKADTAPKS